MSSSGSSINMSLDDLIQNQREATIRRDDRRNKFRRSTQIRRIVFPFIIFIGKPLYTNSRRYDDRRNDYYNPRNTNSVYSFHFPHLNSV